MLAFSVITLQSEQRWKQLADLALSMSEVQLAEQCLVEAKDFNGLLLLTSSTANRTAMQRLADEAKAAGKNNVSFIAMYMLGK